MSMTNLDRVLSTLNFQPVVIDDAIVVHVAYVYGCEVRLEDDHGHLASRGEIHFNDGFENQEFVISRMTNGGVSMHTNDSYAERTMELLAEYGCDEYPADDDVSIAENFKRFLLKACGLISLPAVERPADHQPEPEHVDVDVDDREQCFRDLLMLVCAMECVAAGEHSDDVGLGCDLLKTDRDLCERLLTRLGKSRAIASMID